ncbi:ATP-dependent DNA helicase [Escherichia coli]|uniref:ATP-dependent DNA helicase n=1 Tax=Escherichia coli TaxID=562 RepID=A0A377BR62_ECOLX|nr:ATP-dependent DNA helicase [Escherichia coli]
MLAYLRVLTNPDDDSAFLRIVNTPKREIGPATLKKLGEWAMTRNKSMFTASFDMGLSQTLSGRGYESIDPLHSLVGRNPAPGGAGADCCRCVILIHGWIMNPGCTNIAPARKQPKCA